MKKKCTRKLENAAETNGPEQSLATEVRLERRPEKNLP